jgi:hypothetical protein
VKVGAGLRFLMLSVVVVVVAALCAPLALPGRLSASAADQLRWDLSSGSGSPGKKVTASSLDGDFPVGATITVVGKEKGSKKTFTLCKAEVQPNGNWSCNFTVPKSADGKITISLSSDALTGSTSQDFSVKDSGKGGGGSKGGGNNGGGNNGGNGNNGGRGSGGGSGGRSADGGPGALSQLISRAQARCGITIGSGFLSGPLEAAIKTAASCVPNEPSVQPVADVARCTVTVGGALLATAGLVAVLAPAAGATGGAAATGAAATGSGVASSAGLIAAAKFGAAAAGIALGALEPCDRALLRAMPELAEIRAFDPATPEELGLPPDLPLQATPAAPVGFTPQQAGEEIRNAVAGQVSEPALSAIEQQQTDVRSRACAGVPATGAGGC